MGFLGTITDFLGLTNHAGEARAEARAEEATARQASLANESLKMAKDQAKFQREQYSDWKDIFGNLQEKINHYYENYDASDVIANKLTQINQQYNIQERNLTQTLAQRGLSQSGAEAKGLIQLSQSAAAQKSNVINSATDEAINKKLNFLQLGLGQGVQMLNTNANVSNTGVNAGTSLAGQNVNLANAQTALYGDLSKRNTDFVTKLAGGIAKRYK